jgi:hypothetical protein
LAASQDLGWARRPRNPRFSSVLSAPVALFVSGGSSCARQAGHVRAVPTYQDGFSSVTGALFRVCLGEGVKFLEA